MICRKSILFLQNLFKILPLVQDANKSTFAEMMKLSTTVIDRAITFENVKDDDRRVSNRRGSHITSDQIAGFKEAFDLFDKNGGGTIDANELHKTLEDVGIDLNESDLEDVMMTLDNDGNGEVDFEEFLKLMTGRVFR